MSPRPYALGKRQPQIDEIRRRVVEAARSLLAEAPSYTAFTVDAVAKRADVARATIYYQFGSKTGLLEALCDALAEAGQMAEMAQVFTNPDPSQALRTYIAGFGRFWAADRLLMRRLRSLAALDPDVDSVIAARNDRRRQGLTVLIERLAPGAERSAVARREAALRVLFTLTSFETFDSLAGPSHEPTEVVPLVIELAEAALQLPVGVTERRGRGQASPRTAVKAPKRSRPLT